MKSKNAKTIGYVGLALLAVLFVVVNMVSNKLFQGTRVDLTENQLYTLSPGTLNIVGNIQEPITLYYFFSDQATENVPQLRTYATRVRELLSEYAQLSNGKITLKTIDPIPYSEEEDQATEFGLQGIPVDASGKSIYFGLAGSNSVGDAEVIAFFQPNKEQFLEYDVSKLIYSLQNTKKPVVGLISRLPMFSSFDVETQRIRDPWVISTQLQQFFDVRSIDFAATEFDQDLELLIVVQPRDFSQDTLYAIDQYVMQGGNLLVFVDPYAEADVPIIQQDSPIEAVGARSSNLQALLGPWGIEFTPAEVIGDRKYALTIDTGDGKQERHYAILGLDKAAFNAAESSTAGLDFITMAIAGHVRPKADADIGFTPLITASNESALFETSKFRFLPKVSALAEGFQPTGEEYTLAAHFQLRPSTAFPQGAPNADAKQQAHLTQSPEEVNIVVVADADMLADRMWVKVQNMFGQKITEPWASNGDFTINLVDNLLGSNDLISVRGRAAATKPFTLVEELRREADDQFRVQEQALQTRLRETEQKIASLQSQRSDDGQVLLSPEQSQAIARFQAEKLEVRKQLRRVRHELDKNIRSLGSQLKAINIGLVPALITLIALIISVVRLRKRARRD